MRRMGAEDERGLEQELVHDAPAAAGAIEIEQITMRALGVLVREPEPQKLRRVEGHVGLDSPLMARIRRVLRRVVPRPERPPPPGLDLGPTVPAEAVARLFLERVEDAVAVDVDAALGAADRIDALA